MENLLVNERDRQFVLFEMLELDKLFSTQSYGHFGRTDLEMSMDSALRIAWEKLYPVMQLSDRQGCRFDRGAVHVPEAFHALKRTCDETGITSLGLPALYGGQGYSLLMYMACMEPFMHNPSFTTYLNRPFDAAALIARFGTDEQKQKYLPGLVSGKWGGPVTVTEADAGSDLTAVRTRAIPQEDGSYRIIGHKAMISKGEADLFENIITVAMARAEGAPPGPDGLSLFIVPKYIVDEQGAIGPRNDYTVGGIADMMGLRAWATANISFGDGGQCYAELLGQENAGLQYLMEGLLYGQLAIALQCTGQASSAYLHSLQYARTRIQGASIKDHGDPLAAKVPIIEHPDIRRMLLWMKSEVEGMRFLAYYCGWLVDCGASGAVPGESDKISGLLNILVPLARVYCSDTAFRVAETALQIHGSYGFFKDFPAEQFLRDVKAASLYEGPNGVQALGLCASGLGPYGRNLAILLDEIRSSVTEAELRPDLSDLAAQMGYALESVAGVGKFFGDAADAGQMIVPIAQAYPFTNLLGKLCLGWLLLRQATAASQFLTAISSEEQPLHWDGSAISESDIGFYEAKILTARYYIKNILPFSQGMAAAILNGDLSMLQMGADRF